MKKTETYGMNIIEGSDRIDYTVINENTEFTEALIKENADGIEALSGDIEAIEEVMSDDVAEINKRLKKVEIKATEIVTTFTGDITGDNFTIKNPNSETVTVEYNGLSEDIPAGETIEVRIFADENDYHLELTSPTDVELTYCMRNQKYIEKIASGGITIDEELSATSTNPAQNRAISAEFTKFDIKKISISEKGKENGVAELDENGLVPAERLPEISIDKSDVGLGNVDNTSDNDKPVSVATQTALNSKVDKVEGKNLSSNDFTDEEKEKLESLENYDDTEIKAEIENCIKTPQVAEVGQVLVVKAIDESGKPTEWECTEKGGGGSDDIDILKDIAIYNPNAKAKEVDGGTKILYGDAVITDIASDGTSKFGSIAVGKCKIYTGYKTIGMYAFKSCVELTEIEIPDGVQTIAKGIFKSCTKLKSVTIPSSVTSIAGDGAFGADGAFKGCKDLTIIINKPKNSISGSPWGATNATVIWDG